MTVVSPIKINISYTVSRKELRVMPFGLPVCVTVYDRTSRALRSTEYLFCHNDGKELHIVFLKGK